MPSGFISPKDITYCSASNCIRKDCERHSSSIPKPPPGKKIVYSIADFTETCKDYCLERSSE